MSPAANRLRAYLPLQAVQPSGSTAESLEDSENLPPPNILAQEIVVNLGVALQQFESIVEELGNGS